MAKMGAPLIEIDWKEFDKLCYLQCTKIEIADFFDCSESTIERVVRKKYQTTFDAHIKKKSCKGKISLRRSMYRKAIDQDNTAMQIWLSKQHLKMSDKMNFNWEDITDEEFTEEAKRRLGERKKR